MKTKSCLRSSPYFRLALSLTIVWIGFSASAVRQAWADGDAKASGAADIWGAPADGLQARIIAVSRSADEQHPEIPASAEAPSFMRADDATFLVELKNVSDKPILVQGTRYGDSVSPPWPGKSVSDHFAPSLFDYQLIDSAGKPVSAPTGKMLDMDTMMTVHSGSAETIEPQKSLVMLIRPLRWSDSMARTIGAGQYKLRVHYHGPSQSALAQIKEHWPDKDLVSVWTGDVATGDASFTIAVGAKRPEPQWGKEANGLRAAVEFISPLTTFQGLRDTGDATFPVGSKITVHFLVQNTSDRDISFWSERGRQEDTAVLIDASGKETQLRHPFYSGLALMEHWTLRPGDVAVLSAIPLGIAAKGAADDQFEHPIGAIVSGGPGKYQLRYDLRFGGMRRTDKDGKQIIPTEGDFAGNLSTGLATITARERRPEDDPPTVNAQIQFRSSEGQPVERGQAEVSTPGGRQPLFKGEFSGSALEIPKCPIGSLTVSVRAPGFEETRFYDVAVDEDRPTATLKLTHAEPAKFRLVTADGKPVAGASVRYFVRSKVKAGAGLYPSDGTNGPVWATSNAKGEVVLDTLQKFDPADVKQMGNNMYWFFVEPTELAPRFVGPIEAGQDLGDLAIGPLLTVSGEVHGTPEELRAFQAEWDQPEPMKRGDGTIGWSYAESKPLAAKQDGDKLTFKLSGLRPGTLRIVSRFTRGSKPISHTYTRREPTEDDVVFEVKLTESRDDLVVENKKVNK
jgi:hypothetical protein